MDDDLSLSHTRWNCKYHIVFIPKYRRKEIYGKLRSDIGQIIRQLCSYKDVEIMEAHAMPDYIPPGDGKYHFVCLSCGHEWFEK